MSLLKVAGTTAASGTLYVDDVFSTYLYTGNGSTQTITNGIDLAGKGGLVWGKNRTYTGGLNHTLVDTNRGVGYRLFTNGTNANNYNSSSLTSFDADGFSIGSDSALNYSVAGSNAYVSWTFRKAAKFFDVVTYTGNGVDGRAIPSNLNMGSGYIGLVLVKRTDASSDWKASFRGGQGGQNPWLALNLADADSSAAWVGGNIVPAVNGFNVYAYSGDISAVNASGGTYVAYLFAHDTAADGIIQGGSYVGNGSTTGPIINLGWEPQWILIKRQIGGTGNWQIIDSMRGMPVGSADATLQANLSSAESSIEYLSPTATGFQLTSTSSEVNTSGSTYVYMAIRRPNKPPTSGTQVFEPSTRAGTGATATTTNLAFPLDMVWSKGRDNGGTNSGDFDRLRGATYQLSLNQTDSETTASTSLTGFDVMKGYIAGSDAVQLTINATGYNYINWNFKRAPGFFDEVCYTGTGVDRTVNHNLTVAPELIIVKARSSSGNYWKIYFGSITTALFLNTNDAVIGAGGTWGTTAPTSTVFWVGGSYGDVNGNGKTYVAYLFATLAGISKIGSYTGNGSTGQAIACGFSAGARFVLIKRTDSTGDWYTFDSARGLTSGSSPYVLLNSTAAETTGNNGVYASTGGFTLGSTASTTTNINGASYIYLSVA